MPAAPAMTSERENFHKKEALAVRTSKYTSTTQAAADSRASAQVCREKMEKAAPVFCT